MKIYKLSVAVLFLSGSVFYAQEVKKDTISKEKRIEGVVIQGSSSKKTETAVLGEQKKAIIQKQAVSASVSRQDVLRSVLFPILQSNKMDLFLLNE